MFVESSLPAEDPPVDFSNNVTRRDKRLALSLAVIHRETSACSSCLHCQKLQSPFYRVLPVSPLSPVSLWSALWSAVTSSQVPRTPLYPAVPYSQTSQTLSLPCSSLKSAVADIPLPCTCPQPCPRHPSTLHFDLQSIATDTPPPCTYLMSDAVKRHSPLPILTVKHHKHQSSPTV